MKASLIVLVLALINLATVKIAAADDRLTCDEDKFSIWITYREGRVPMAYEIPYVERSGRQDYWAMRTNCESLKEKLLSVNEQVYRWVQECTVINNHMAFVKKKEMGLVLNHDVIWFSPYGETDFLVTEGYLEILNPKECLSL